MNASADFVSWSAWRRRSCTTVAILAFAASAPTPVQDRNISSLRRCTSSAIDCTVCAVRVHIVARLPRSLASPLRTRSARS